MYVLGFILHFILKIFGAVFFGFQTRLALFWSLSVSTLIILVVSVIKIFISGTIEFVIVVLSELIIVYIFSRIVSFVSNFKDRNLFTFVITSLYFIPVVLINFSSGT